MYRKRALQVVEEKELLLSDAHKKLSLAGVAFEYRGMTARRTTSVGAASDSARRNAVASLAADESTTDEFLKNIILKYMCTEQLEVKEHMEKAIATVLKFSPSEIANVEKSRKESQPWEWTLW